MKKHFSCLSVFFLLIWLAASCSQAKPSAESLLADAELSYDHGQYPQAQLLADSVVSLSVRQPMSVDGLCRLSLLFMHLGERSGEEANIVNATRALDAAALLDTDSTQMFIRSLPAEDKARLILVGAISEGSRHIINTDSLFNGVDSIID